MSEQLPHSAPALSRPVITFVVTALNEEDKIEATASTIRSAVEGLHPDYEIVLVDDGSTDRTGEIMDRMAAGDEHLRVIHNIRNQGLGGAYKTGLAAARGNHVMWVSGDNAETVDNLRNIISHVGKADIIIPVLLDMTNRPLFRRFTSRTFTMIVNLLFGLHVRYYNGAVVHRTDLVRSIRIITDSFAYQAEALIKLLKTGRSYIEVPYRSASYDGVFSHAMKPKNLAGVFKALGRTFLEVRLGTGKSGRP